MLELLVNGRSFLGWKSATVTRALDQLSATFGLTVSDRFDGTTWRIKPGDACKLIYKNITVITGYVDQVTITYDGKSKSISVTGRSKVADIADCSSSPKQYRGFTLSQIAEDMVKPFGLKVVNNVSDLKAIPTYKPDEGTKIFDALEKLARVSGVILTDNTDGNLVITRIGTSIATTVLELGNNIKACNAIFDHRDRYSTYKVKSQTKSNDFVSGASSAHISSTETDSHVRRHRPLTISAEDQADLIETKRRALWEKNTRWGRSQSITYTVFDWVSEGKLWEPNIKVNVRDSILGFAKILVINEVTYSLDDNGTLANIRVIPSQGLDIAPIVVSTADKIESVQWDFLNAT